MCKESSPSKRTVEFWAGEFKRGLTRLENEGRPITATTTEIIEQVHNIVEDPSVTKREITNAEGIADVRVLHFVNGEHGLHMKKLFRK